MSHDYVKCSHCLRPVMEHLAYHTSEDGSLCGACYAKSGLKEKHEEEQSSYMRVCTECGKEYLKRNFKTPYPETTCTKCGEVGLAQKEELGRDVDFDSDENQARSIVLGFLHHEGKRVGMRVLQRPEATVVNVKIPENGKYWNLNINNGNLYPKCCKLSEFPQIHPENANDSPFSPGTGKLLTKTSGAWVLEELPNSIFRLVSVSGQLKDVAEAPALNFHKTFNIANAEIVDGKLQGTFKKSEVPSTTGEVLSVDNSEDISKMKELNIELLAACKAYYAEDDSPLTDLEYDAKFDQLLDLEHKTGVVLPDSVTLGVGTPVIGKLPKVDHKDRLLSLDKTKDVGTLQGLLNLDLDGELGVLSWKMDGLTVLATYKGGKLIQAATRGDGKIGEDVTHNAKFFKNMPRRIPYTGEIRVRGEAVIAYSTFERINASLPEGQEPYKNPRNLASGTVRRSEITRDGSVEFVPFGVVVDDPKFKPSTYSQSLSFLEGQGFKVVDRVMCTSDGLPEAVEIFKKKIDGFDYPTDGLVLAIDDVAVYEKLGTTGRHPRGSMAFKWADEVAETELLDIEWSVSRTGVITPVAIFKPVELEGTTVRRASLHNLSILKKLLGNPYIGQKLWIIKSNMIIPTVIKAEK